MKLPIRFDENKGVIYDAEDKLICLTMYFHGNYDNQKQDMRDIVEAVNSRAEKNNESIDIKKLKSYILDIRYQNRSQPFEWGKRIEELCNEALGESSKAEPVKDDGEGDATIVCMVCLKPLRLTEKDADQACEIIMEHQRTCSADMRSRLDALEAERKELIERNGKLSNTVHRLGNESLMVDNDNLRTQNAAQAKEIEQQKNVIFNYDSQIQSLTAENKVLAERNEKLETAFAGCQKCKEQYEAEVKTLAERNEKLEATLNTYGRHTIRCALENCLPRNEGETECTCGWADYVLEQALQEQARNHANHSDATRNVQSPFYAQNLHGLRLGD